MPVLLWLVRLLGSTVAWLVNVTLSLGLFLLSAHLFALDDADAAVPGYILRGIAAIWLFAATWQYLKHGVLQRPKPKPAQHKIKIGTKEGLLSTLGCFATIGAIAVTAVVVGPYADWAYAGLVGDDPTHPARVAMHDLARRAEGLAADPERVFGYGVALVVGLIVLRVVTAVGRRRQEPTEAGESRRQRSRRRREAAASTPRQAPTQAAPAGTPTPAARGDAHVAHPPPSSKPRTSRSGRTIDDPLLGTLHRDDGAGGWRRAPGGANVGGLVIEAEGEPTPQQMEIGRAIVQRSFEVLLRASDAARPAAQAHGVGLPRFTIVDSIVHDDGRNHPRVTVRLRVEGDAARVYEVTSVDGLQTFDVK